MLLRIEKLYPWPLNISKHLTVMNMRYNVNAKTFVIVRALKKLLTFPLVKCGFININVPVIIGDPKRVIIGKNVMLYNSILNTHSGFIIIEDHVTVLPNSIIVTGTHNFSKKNNERRNDYPKSGRNICIRRGAWIGSGAIILGNVTIGENSVVGAGSVVTKDVDPYCIVVGNPAKTIKKLPDPTTKNE